MEARFKEEVGPGVKVEHHSGGKTNTASFFSSVASQRGEVYFPCADGFEFEITIRPKHEKAPQ